MPTIVGDVLQVTTDFVKGGTTASMVFHYRVNATSPGPLNNLADVFESVMIPTLTNLMHNSAYCSRVYVKNLFDPELFVERMFGSTEFPGELSPTPMPDHVACAFKATRTRLDMRHGWKRLPFIVEDMTVGESWNGSYLAGLTAVAGFLSAILDGDNDEKYQPIIVKRVKEVDGDGKVTYRLPNEQSELVYFVATYSLYPYISSQNTRKKSRHS